MSSNRLGSNSILILTASVRTRRESSTATPGVVGLTSRVHPLPLPPLAWSPIELLQLAERSWRERGECLLRSCCAGDLSRTRDTEGSLKEDEANEQISSNLMCFVFKCYVLLSLSYFKFVGLYYFENDLFVTTIYVLFPI